MKILMVTFGDFDVDWYSGMRWRIQSPFECTVTISQFETDVCPLPVTVPVGFITDLASVPRALWSLFPPEGQYTKAAALHDYLYAVVGQVNAKTLRTSVVNFSRAGVDAIFLEGMNALGVSVFTRRTMWAAVRVFGGGHWGADKHEWVGKPPSPQGAK